jgi:hypothetical protein
LKIQLLRKREDFLEIFQKSSALFFQNFFSRSDYVKIDYIVNDYLNVVYPSKIDRNSLSNLVSEFKYHHKLYRRILQSIYTFLAIRRPFEIIFSSGSVAISVPTDVKNRWVFIPGNHSIRAVDLDKNRCFVFLKYGFNNKFLESDASIRVEHTWLKAPKVFQYKNDWYEEQRVVGLPWNRLSSDILKKKVIVKAQNQLSNLYRQTVVEVSLSGYISKICNDILSLLSASLSSLPDKDKIIISNFISKVESSFDNYIGNEKIDLVKTHGDFQPGNILCSENDFWIIDWEYSDQRSIFYDALVFDLECRSPFALSIRLDKKINELIGIDTYLGWTGKVLDNNKKHYFSIFFLEDLLLRMNEISVEPIQAKSEALFIYLAELTAIQTILIKCIKN